MGSNTEKLRSKLARRRTQEKVHGVLKTMRSSMYKSHGQSPTKRSDAMKDLYYDSKDPRKGKKK